MLSMSRGVINCAKLLLSHRFSRIKSFDQWAVDRDPFLTSTTSAKIGKRAIYRTLRTVSDSPNLSYGPTAVQNDFGQFWTVRNAKTVDPPPAATLRTARLARGCGFLTATAQSWISSGHCKCGRGDSRCSMQVTGQSDDTDGGLMPSDATNETMGTKRTVRESPCRRPSLLSCPL